MMAKKHKCVPSQEDRVMRISLAETPDLSPRVDAFSCLTRPWGCKDAAGPGTSSKSHQTGLPGSKQLGDRSMNDTQLP